MAGAGNFVHVRIHLSSSGLRPTHTESSIETLQLSPEVLDWAARQAGETLVEFAPRVSKKSGAAIASGRLTAAQAEKFARLANVPFGYLFFPEPPSERESTLADFRSVLKRKLLSQDFYALLDDIIVKQTWYRDYLKSISAPELTFIGSFDVEISTAKDVATDIAVVLGLEPQELRAEASARGVYTVLADRAETVGILIFKSGVVGNNTRRPLSVKEFRGFALSDKRAPVVFVNGADAEAAWQFTLAHELAHLWIGDSAVSSAQPGSEHAHEVFCNAVAAELLVPVKEFRRQWNLISNENTVAAIDRLRRHFKVSGLVVARRALDDKLISQSEYDSFYDAAKKKSGGSGGNFYSTLGARNGKRFAKMVASLAIAGELGLRHAARLLNTTPTAVINYYERLES